MEIFVKVVSEFSGWSAWWNHANGESYFCDGDELEASGVYEDYLRGTPFKSVTEAKREGRRAKADAGFAGICCTKVKYYRYVRGKLTETKFTRDGKIKQ